MSSHRVNTATLHIQIFSVQERDPSHLTSVLSGCSCNLHKVVLLGRFNAQKLRQDYMRRCTKVNNLLPYASTHWLQAKPYVSELDHLHTPGLMLRMFGAILIGDTDWRYNHWDAVVDSVVWLWSFFKFLDVISVPLRLSRSLHVTGY